MGMNSETIDRWLRASKQDPSIFNISTCCDEASLLKRKQGYIDWHGMSEEEADKKSRNATLAKSTIKKFHSINTSNPTCQVILKQFNENNCFLCFKDNWNTYKSYNPQFNNWEYMCLLKMVWDGKLEVMIGLHNGRRRLFFKTISGDGYFSKPKEETTRSKNK